MKSADLGSVTAGQEVSSPRLRGLLGGSPPSESAERVVPAPAGVAPTPSRSSARTPCRPRACGGCSGSTGTVWLADGSSPRLRGLLLDHLRRPRPHQVVPAPAGVAPGQQRWRSPDGRRPRACGGCSMMLRTRPSKVWSSPRLRGLLVAWRPRPGAGRVVPAPAGVAPPPPPPRSPPSSRPRACGGCSCAHARRAPLAMSSPRLRGLLGVPQGVQSARRVVPAPAGVAPNITGMPSRATSRPRACGGCSPPPAASPAPPPVVPAPAGVARGRGRRGPARPRRPRACGGCSLWRKWRKTRRQSSPRLRGLLHHRRARGVHPAVVPAPAGVARR